MNALTAAAIGWVAMTGSLQAIYDPAPRTIDPFIQTMQSTVNQVIEHAEDIPGLQSEEFQRIREGISAYWNRLVQEGEIEITASDQEIRPYFVALQAIVEHTLACELGQEIQSLTGVIHTPMPATPLCTESAISEGLVDSSIEQDPLRLFTVQARTKIMREYLQKGGNLYVVYPRTGIEKRSEAQQLVYRKELEKHPAHLFDRPLHCVAIDEAKIGAFYFFQNQEGTLFAFAIRMTQANHPQQTGTFGLWFGEVYSDAPVSRRISAVLETLRRDSPLPIANDFLEYFTL